MEKSINTENLTTTKRRRRIIWFVVVKEKNIKMKTIVWELKIKGKKEQKRIALNNGKTIIKWNFVLIIFSKNVINWNWSKNEKEEIVLFIIEI